LSVFDDRVTNYAVEPAAKAGGLAAGVILLAVILHIPRPVAIRPGTLFVATFFVVFLGYLTWRIIRRAGDKALYRASGKALTLDDDVSDTRRITAVGFFSGVIVVAALWLSTL